MGKIVITQNETTDNGIVIINGDEYFQIISDGMMDFMTKDKSIRILAFPEGGEDWYDKDAEKHFWEITLYKREVNNRYEGVRNGYYEYTIDGLFTTEEFEIFKRNFVIDKTFTISTDKVVHDESEYKTMLKRELKTMLLIES